MYGRSEQPQQWSVHAEFTISHDGLNDSNVPPQTHTQQDENGVRMVYSWSSEPPAQPSNDGNQWGSTSTTGSQYSTNTAQNQWHPNQNNPQPSTPSDVSEKPASGSYGFQRGNMLFTSVPPSKRPGSFPENVTNNTNPTKPTMGNKLGLNIQDSGYSSDLLSPNSFASSTLPRRPSQQYNRRCRSTCSIVLSTAYNEMNPAETQTEPQSQHCSRTHSLRCQTPTLQRERRDSYYGCGDPWCYHANYGEDFCCGRFSPVPENEEYNTTSSTKRPSRASTYTPGVVTADKTKVTTTSKQMPLKDACVQTFEMVDKCTSPFMKVDSFNFKKDSQIEAKPKREKKKRYYNSRRKTEPLNQQTRSPSSFTPDSLENRQSERHLMRSPARLQYLKEYQNDKKGSNSDSKASDKKPRTVHIDVYCTGTEQESDASTSSTDSENKTASSPQTVFESDKVVVTHKRATDTVLPQRLQETLNADEKQAPKNETENINEKDESDDDGISTCYPSQMSSFSHMRDFGSSLSSVPPSWSTYSMSSCAIPDADYDSVANTSWKDTVSDFDSLMQSRSSVAQTESLVFVPRRFSHATQKSESIDECVEVEEPPESIECQSKSSLLPSDSFEYANSEDRRRIKKMEQMWGTNKPWKSPQLERKHLLQQRKLKEYLDKRLKELPKWESKETESEDSDASEKGWTFVKDSEKKLERDTTIRRTSKEDNKIGTKSKMSLQMPKTMVRKEPEIKVTTTNEMSADVEYESLSDSSPRNASKSPSTIALKQRLSLDPSLRAPFTIVPGIYTDQRQIAKKFGQIVDVFKKPGHHVGPVKNPDCLCAHCRSYCASIGYRNRTRSVGEAPNVMTYNWKEMKANQSAKHIPENPLPYTDF